VIHPEIMNGSIKGRDNKGYFANSIFLSQLTVGYTTNLPQLKGYNTKLKFKAGIGIIKSEIIRYQYDINKTTTINYPFYTYNMGLEYQYQITSSTA
jgi:hypothetical protein